MEEIIFYETLRGIFMSLLYFFVTKDPIDSTLTNVITYAAYYVMISLSARALGLGENAAAAAFLSKTIFTAVEERTSQTNTTKA